MPQGEPIKDFYGRIMGYVETKSNGEVWAYDFYGRLLGKYYPGDNTTRDFYGRILTRGNTVAGLIPPVENQR